MNWLLSLGLMAGALAIVAGAAYVSVRRANKVALEFAARQTRRTVDRASWQSVGRP
jgi:hypothetical protein